MFGFFKPKCPVTARQKAWTEFRLSWLCRQFGLDRMVSSPVLLPTDGRFAGFDGSEESGRALFKTICDILAVPAETISLEFDPELKRRGAAGLYVHDGSVGQVRIATSELDDGESIVATMVHEVAHQILMSAGHSDQTMGDHEHVTDLFAVYSGFGIFSANAVIREKYESHGRWSSWRIGRHGYLTAADYGYALAVHLQARQEGVPDWQHFLRLDARASMTSGLKYICDTGDCLFQLHYDRGNRDWSEAELRADLADELDGTRFAALREVGRQKISAGPIVSAVVDRINDKNNGVRIVAIRTLARIGPAAQIATPLLIAAVSDVAPEIRAQAIRALGRIQPDATTLSNAEFLLTDSDKHVVAQAVGAISRYGIVPAQTMNQLHPVLRAAFIECEYSLSGKIVAIIARLSADPEAILRSFFDDDEELQNMALMALEELRAKQVDEPDATPTS
jgi:hypothetical protein